MNQEELRLSIEMSAYFEFSRSQGPGGQNVNKVNTKAEIRLRIDAIKGLNASEIEQVLRILKNRITKEGELCLSSQETRSQAENRALAFERMFALIANAAHIQKPRKPSKPGRAAVERRLQSKSVNAKKKLNRNTSYSDE